MSSGLNNDYGTASGHPLVGFADALESLLDHAAEANAWTMTSAELQAVLPRLTRAKARLAEVELRVLREADRHSVGDDVGATNTPAWWAHATGQPVPLAHGLATLAARLDNDAHETTRAAMATGRVQIDQARVILDAIDALPAELVPPATITDAEAHLVRLADLDGETRLDPKALRVAGRKVLEVLAPDLAEHHEKTLLEAEERHAAATATFSMRPDGHGSVHGRFKIPVLHAEILAKHLNAIAAPRHRHAITATAPTSTSPSGGSTGTGESTGRVARPLRWGHAFLEYLETRAASGTPKAGGLAATVVVTMTLEQLLGGLQGSEKPAVLDTGAQVSADQVRRLACEAGIIPAVLGGPSQVLDLGRKTRFHTEPQRIALILKHRGCAADGCDWPPGMCHAHHKKPWHEGGGTSFEEGILLCPRHHTLAHDSCYTMTETTGSTGRKVTFTRRT